MALHIGGAPNSLEKWTTIVHGAPYSGEGTIMVYGGTYPVTIHQLSPLAHIEPMQILHLLRPLPFLRLSL